MGKERSPEEVAARKAKKEAKQAATREARGAEEVAAWKAKKDTKKDAKRPSNAATREARRARGAEEGPAGAVGQASAAPARAARARPEGARDSLADRLNPARACFDAELKGAWKSMPAEKRKRLVAEDKAANKAARAAAAAAAREAPELPFEANPDDHCETSLAAYGDVVQLLELLAQKLGKAPEELRIYDPYYCSGAVVRHLGAWGFPNVHNRCEDFYDIVAKGLVPEFDVVVTNPPYSEDAEGGTNHIDRLLKFCLKECKPFLINMPEYVSSAAHYKKRFAAGGDPKRRGAPLLLCPYQRYHFWTPVGLRRDKEKANPNAHRNPELGIRCSPFVALWYVSTEPVLPVAKVLRRASKGLLEGIDTAEAPGSKEKRRCRLCTGAEELPASRASFKRRSVLLYTVSACVNCSYVMEKGSPGRQRKTETEIGTETETCVSHTHKHAHSHIIDVWTYESIHTYTHTHRHTRTHIHRRTETRQVHFRRRRRRCGRAAGEAAQRDRARLRRAMGESGELPKSSIVREVEWFLRI